MLYQRGLCAPHHRHAYIHIPTHTPYPPLQTKAALTREYNKGSHKSQALAWGQGIKVYGWWGCVIHTYVWMGWMGRCHMDADAFHQCMCAPTPRPPEQHKHTQAIQPLTLQHYTHNPTGRQEEGRRRRRARQDRCVSIYPSTYRLCLNVSQLFFCSYTRPHTP